MSLMLEVVTEFDKPLLFDWVSVLVCTPVSLVMLIYWSRHGHVSEHTQFIKLCGA